jgi:hypothetical protein
MDPEQRMGILRVLGQVHIADDVAEGDIKGKEQFKVHDTNFSRGKMLTSQSP